MLFFAQITSEVFYIWSRLFEGPGQERRTVPRVRDSVQVTQDKTRHSPRGWQLGKPGEGNSLLHYKPTDQPTNQPTNQRANKQTASPSWISVLSSPQPAWFLERSLLPLPLRIPAQPRQQLSLHLGCAPRPPVNPQLPTTNTQVVFVARQLFSGVGH